MNSHLPAHPVLPKYWKFLIRRLVLGRVFKVFQTIKNLIKSLHSENGANGCQDLLLMTKCGTN
ncbi:hypothetical protein, partial [Legionella septentrionalis]|uniref:hypothetical protein n=1 Tax=Legionella septentrionalis TaxID=2498109 RepID=UPI001F3861BA